VISANHYETLEKPSIIEPIKGAMNKPGKAEN